MERRDRIARAAGVLEGEGSFLTRTGSKYPRISCCMTDRDVLEELLSLFGGAIYPITKQKAHYKQAWRWEIGGDESADVMELLKQYMFARRRDKIDEVLSGWYSFKDDKDLKKKDREERVLGALRAYEDGMITMTMAGELYGFSWLTVQKELNKQRGIPNWKPSKF